MRVAVTCYYCKKTDEIRMTPGALSSWFNEGKMLAPDASDERVWELLKNSVTCPDCVKDHPPGPGAHAIGCECGKCQISDRKEPAGTRITKRENGAN
jgi:hypothetical protein